MLPGFRFLLAAIVLSMSVLVFGLGAAALLRAAHEEFATNPSWRAPPQTVFAPPVDTTPVLAMLRVDTPVENASDNAPAAAMQPETRQPETLQLETMAAPSAPIESERVASLREEPALSEPIKTANENAEAAAPNPAPTVTVTEAPPSNEPPSVTAGEASSMMNQTASATPESAVAAPSQVDLAKTKIATLGGPAVSIIETPAKVSDAVSIRTAAKKRAQTKHRPQRRRIVRPRATPTPQFAQQPNPFGQPTPTIRTR